MVANVDDHCGYEFPWSPVRWFPLAAATVAARFRERYDPEQRAIFVMLFLENVASMAATAPQPPRAVQAAPGDDRTAQLGTMVGYVEACLAAAPEAAAVAKDEV